LIARLQSNLKGKQMKSSLLIPMLVLAACGACARHKPVVDATRPLAAQQTAARDRVEQRGRYDVNHDPNDTMSINSMGSD
jgi:hypothetical protein